MLTNERKKELRDKIEKLFEMKDSFLFERKGDISEKIESLQRHSIDALDRLLEEGANPKVTDIRITYLARELVSTTFSGRKEIAKLTQENLEKTKSLAEDFMRQPEVLEVIGNSVDLNEEEASYMAKVYEQLSTVRSITQMMGEKFGPDVQIKSLGSIGADSQEDAQSKLNALLSKSKRSTGIEIDPD